MLDGLNTLNEEQLAHCGWLADMSFMVGAVGMLVSAVLGLAVFSYISEDLALRTTVASVGGIAVFLAALFAAYCVLYYRVIAAFNRRIVAVALRALGSS